MSNKTEGLQVEVEDFRVKLKRGDEEIEIRREGGAISVLKAITKVWGRGLINEIQ